MKKPTRKTSKKSAPVQPEQFHALRRLARNGKIEEALAQVDRLIADHPGYKPLYGLAWEIAGMTGDAGLAAARAYEWTQVSPNSAAAWAALSEHALQWGCYTLGMEARRRLDALAGHAEPPAEPIDTPFGPVSWEDSLANDIGRICMHLGQLDKADAALAGCHTHACRNNKAIIAFHRGDIDSALSMFQENCQREPRNLLADAMLIRLKLWRLGGDGAAGLADPLRHTPACRSDDAMAKIEALLLLGDWAGADAAWRESSDADFWEGIHESEASGRFDWAGAIAAWRLGEQEAVKQRLEMAVRNLPERRRAAAHFILSLELPEMGQQPESLLGEVSSWFPMAMLDRLRDIVRQEDTDGRDRFRSELLACDAHPDYLVAAAELGGDKARDMALIVLLARARDGDEPARQALLDLLRRPCGQDEVRNRLLSDMVSYGLLTPRATVSVLLEGQVREIRNFHKQIHADPKPSRLPPDSYERYVQAHELLDKGKHQAALSIFAALCERHPEEPSLYANLAAVKERLGHPEAEIESLYARAHALDPQYLFGITGLARIAASRGEVDKAKQMLDPLLERDVYHYTEWMAILLAQAEIARAQGKPFEAFKLLKQARQTKEQFL